jgi:hypothetical protein
MCWQQFKIAGGRYSNTAFTPLGASPPDGCDVGDIGLPLPVRGAGISRNGRST